MNYDGLIKNGSIFMFLHSIPTIPNAFSIKKRLRKKSFFALDIFITILLVNYASSQVK